MKKRSLLLTACLIICLLLTGCGGPKASELKDMRELSWEGTELTVTVGTNKSSGCEWTAEFEDDSIIDYSINRKFNIVSNKDGQSVGYSEIGFEGKSAGTTTITLTTPCDWDGSGEGYTYVVTVTVDEDGTIVSAEGENVAAKDVKQDEASEPESVAGVYYPFALGDGEYCIAGNFEEGDGVVTLNEDGTGSMITGPVENPFSWKYEDGTVTMFDESGTIPMFTGTIENGILTLDMSVASEDGAKETHIGYFAVKGADTSSFETITADEYQALKETAPTSD